MEVDVIGETDHAGRLTGVANGRILGLDDQKLYATGSTTCAVMKVTWFVGYGTVKNVNHLIAMQFWIEAPSIL